MPQDPAAISIEQVISYMRKEGKRLIDIAQTDDVYRQGERMLSSVRLYELGKHGLLPDEWKQYVGPAAAQADPEYANYQRLKAKFE